MRKISSLAFGVAMALGLAACSEAPQTNQSSSATEQQVEQQLSSGVSLNNLETSVRPQDNFFRYVNGQWLERTEIPSDRARWGSFDELRERAEEQVLAIVLAAAETSGEANSNAQKIGDLFRSYMNEDRVEELGISPLAADFERIASLQAHADLAEFWGYNQRYRAATPVNLGVGQDQMNSEEHITSISQSGLGLPDRDYYLADDERNQTLRGSTF